MQPELCPNVTGGAAAPTAEAGGQVRAPWTGAAMGLIDVGLVAGRARPLVVGVCGAEKAGKTTLLASWYILIGRGRPVVDARRFAGSLTLEGWEALAAHMRWEPGGQGPVFPPHTTSQTGRAPGLLHLAFRRADDRLQDVLFADAPGEWFRHWAVNETSSDAEGARWISDQADLLLIIADCDALSGETVGDARHDLQILAPRVGQHRRGRPVALVWAKADVDVAPDVRQAVRAAVFKYLPDAVEFECSVKPDADGREAPGMLDLLDWILVQPRPAVTLPVRHARGVDPLFDFGAVP